MEMPQPTAEHKHILAGVGEWEGTLTMYMPGMPASAVPAHETVTPVGEFWIQSRFTCDFMGQPYLGTGTHGYDVNKKKYVSTWADSMSSHMSLMEGNVDPKTKALVMHWEAPGMSGGMEKHRSETVHADNSYTMTFFTGEGEGTKSMVIDMKRKGGKTSEAGAPKK
ncbi:MAG: DUF1579 family protein [Planctomycetes bacterium]|nr:DUF1579 family protein [Planctomycetota bacterium]